MWLQWRQLEPNQTGSHGHDKSAADFRNRARADTGGMEHKGEKTMSGVGKKKKKKTLTRKSERSRWAEIILTT